MIQVRQRSVALMGIAMLFVQVAYAIVNVLYTLAANEGMNPSILVAYRMMFAATVTLTVAIISECRKSVPKLTWMVVLKITVCALLGATFYQNMYSASLAMTTATITSAMTNLVPAITIVFAVVLRLERLELGSLRGKLKAAGILVGICGAMVLVFYEGVEINLWHTLTDLLHGQTPGLHHRHILGIFLAICCPFFSALSLIIQANLSDIYNYRCTTAALINFTASVQCAVYAFCRESDTRRWRLGWDVKLLTVTFSGIAASGIPSIVIMWCVRLQGPLFVSLFNPLNTIFTAIIGSLFLDQKIHLGSIIGFIFIACGLFILLWAKWNELRETKNHTEPEADALDRAYSSS